VVPVVKFDAKREGDPGIGKPDGEHRKPNHPKRLRKLCAGVDGVLPETLAANPRIAVMRLVAIPTARLASHHDLNRSSVRLMGSP
jgi:hypothetical protein